MCSSVSVMWEPGKALRCSGLDEITSHAVQGADSGDQGGSELFQLVLPRCGPDG